MKTEIILNAIAIIFPFLEAITFFKQNKMLGASRKRATIVIASAGAVTALKFILTKEYSCFLVTGRDTCFYSGFGSVSLVLISIISVGICLRREENERHDYIFLLLFNGSWAGFALLDSWILSLAFLNLLLISTGRWVRARGGSVSFFFSRDDYKDDIGPE